MGWALGAFPRRAALSVKEIVYTRLTRKDAITELLERINGQRSTLTTSKK